MHFDKYKHQWDKQSQSTRSSHNLWFLSSSNTSVFSHNTAGFEYRGKMDPHFPARLTISEAWEVSRRCSPVTLVQTL